MPDHHLDPPNPDLELVMVFKTDDPGLFPLAKLALEEANIEFLVSRPATALPEVYKPVTPEFTGANEPAEIVVAADDAKQAREVLAGLLNPDAVKVEPPSE